MDNSENKVVVDKNDEIDLAEIFYKIWQGKFVIILFIILAFLLGVMYLKQQPKIFTARSVFGFDNSSTRGNFIPEELSFFTNINNINSNEDIITQIKGKDFLRKIIIKLNLLEKPEFAKLFINEGRVNFFSIQNLKDKVKTLINYEKFEIENSLSFKIETILTIFEENLQINSLKTGGYEIIVSSESPEDASLIANTIVTDYLDLKLKTKILKSEKALDYLSEKLGEAKLFMDIAKNAAETFALKQNILSEEEFTLQSSRLEEFRTSIEKLTSNYELLKKYYELIKSEELKKSEYEKIIQDIIDISPRIKPTKRLLDSQGKRDLKKEIDYLLNKIPNEILRLEESLKITKKSFNNLENKAKKTSQEARELQNLQREVGYTQARYDALLKEFEKKSLIEGFEDALGEIYETALPPIQPSSPKPNLIMLLSIVLGAFFGIFVVLLKFAISNKISNKLAFQESLRLTNCLLLSNKILNLKSLSFQLNNKISSYVKKDLFLIDSVGFKISRNLTSGKKTVLNCTTFGTNISSLFLGIALAKFFSSHNKKVHVINYCKPPGKYFSFFNKNKSGIIDKISKNNQNLSYTEVTIYPYMEEPGLTSEIDKKDIVITITQQASSEVNSVHQIFNSDYFIICGIKEKTYLKEIQRFKEAIGDNMQKCISGIFVSR